MRFEEFQRLPRSERNMVIDALNQKIEDYNKSGQVEDR